MATFTFRCAGLLIAGCLLAACSGADSASRTAASASADSRATAAVPVAATVCERKLLVPADVAGLLSEPVTGTKPLKGDPETCYFITATDELGGPEIGVTLRQGNGRDTIKSWLSGRMGADAVTIAGVGESAVWVAELGELDAQKDDRLCVVALGGSALIHHPAGFQSKAGQLCNKILAAP